MKSIFGRLLAVAALMAFCVPANAQHAFLRDDATEARPTCADLSNGTASCSTDTTNAGNLSSGTLSAARLPAFTGDVTSPAGSSVNTIAVGAVTNAKLATMATGIKGNNTAAAAAPIDLTAAQAKTMLNLGLNAFDFMTAAQISDVKARTCILDVTTPLNTAATAAAGVADLTLSSGTFCQSNTVVINTGLILRGQGPGLTILKHLAGASTNMLQTLNFSTLTGSNTAAGPFKWGVYELSLDGNATNTTGSADNFDIYGYDYDVYHVESHNSRGIGINSEWATAAGVPVGQSGDDEMNARITNVKTFNNLGSAGFAFCGPHDSVITALDSFLNQQSNIILQDSATCSTGGTFANNIHAYFAKTGTGIFISANPIYANGLESESNPTTEGIQVGSAGRLIGTNVTAFNNLGSSSHGIELVGSGSMLTNVWSFGNGSDGIVASGNNNIITSATTTGNGNVGVILSGTNNILNGAVASGNATTQYTIGTGNFAANNH